MAVLSAGRGLEVEAEVEAELKHSSFIHIVLT